MAKIKTISLTGYVTRLLAAAFSGVVVVLMLALLLFQVLISTEKIAPANAGEIHAREEMKRIEENQVFPAKLSPSFYQYVYFTKEGKVHAASLAGEPLEKTLAQYKDKTDSYSTGAYVTLADGSYALFSWNYKAQFTNPTLRKLFPNFESFFLIAIVLALLLFFLLFTKKVSKQLKEKLLLVEQASQQITQKDLDSVIGTTSGIREFNEVLHSMEEMRGALKDSLVQQWQTEQQRKKEIAALTHDIKTPLTIINGNAELLMEEELAEEQQQLVQHIYDSGKKTKQYLDLLQQVSTFDVVQEEKSPLSVTTILEEVRQTFAPLAKKKGIELAIGPSPQGTAINAAPVMLMRALGNLLENAIRYTDSGKVTVETVHDEKSIRFVIEDHGPGFSPEALLHGKEMFWQENQSRTTGSNYGIGLAIVERIANYHEGQVIVENTTVGGKVTLILSNEETLRP